MIELSFEPPDRLTVVSPVARLREARPVVNGQELENVQSQLLSSNRGGCTLKWTAPLLGDGAFTLEASQDGDQIRLQYWLEDIPAGFVLDSFGLRFRAVENLGRYLCNGYYSWDSSLYIQPEAVDADTTGAQAETGYAVTQILPKEGRGSLVIGFDRQDRFQQTFAFDARQSPPSLTILTWWDRKTLTGPVGDEADRISSAASAARDPGATSALRAASESLVIFDHPGVEEGLRRWARLLAAAAPIPARLSAPPITGWCSWYNLYATIDEPVILDHLHAAARAAREYDLPMRVFQIDDGFTPEMGDWLEVKPQFPRGMKPLLDEIRNEGFIPGLWIAPFMVGNRSRLYREHPDWVVGDRLTGGPLAQMAFYGEFRWHKRSEEYYILDTTHPDAFDYLRQVFHTWRHEWGCEYFKTDFMHFGAAHGPDRAVWHTPGMTRIQIWRRTAEMIRQEIGEALWLGCGCPLWASVGLVDAVRAGRDVGVNWDGALPAEKLLQNLAGRNFANHILWQADPDCVLLRQRFHHLSEGELTSLALFTGMLGGVTMTSDHLGELSAERMRLWKLILPRRIEKCSFPRSGLMYSSVPQEAAGSTSAGADMIPTDPVLVQTRPLSGGCTAVLFFNSGDAPAERQYGLDELGFSVPQYIYDWNTDAPSSEVQFMIDVTLGPHESRLLFLATQPLSDIPVQL